MMIILVKTPHQKRTSGSKRKMDRGDNDNNGSIKKHITTKTYLDGNNYIVEYLGGRIIIDSSLPLKRVSVNNDGSADIFFK